MASVDKINEPDLWDKKILSRGQLLEIEQDPTKMQTLARIMGAVNLDNLFRAMQDPNVAPAARLEFQKMLNKMGGLEPKEDKAGAAQAGPQVLINITRAKDTESVVIEGQKVD